MLRISKGEIAAFSRLYDLFAKPLSALVYRILRDMDEVEEVVQDVFVVIWNQASKYDPILSRPFSWIVVIAKRMCWNKLRARGRHNRKLQALESEGSGPVIPASEKLPSELTEIIEVSEDVQRRLELFPETQEKVIQMALYDGFTQEEIADVMDLPLGTVKTWIRRGVLKIRKELESEI